MSFNRENVTWVSRDGTWHIGFFTVVACGDDDPEWDVEYDDSRFEDVYDGTSEQDVWRVYHRDGGANPGGSTIYEKPNAETDHFDAIRKACLASRTREPALRRGW